MKHILALACLAASAPVFAAEDIVVTGKALSREEAREKALSYVQAVGLVTTVRPAARWLDPICPHASGLADAAIAKRVETRIADIARSIGARVAKGNCTHNLVVIFATDTDDLARRITEKDPRLMSDMSRQARGKIVGAKAPVRWWYRSDVRSADGMTTTNAPPPWMQIEMDGGSGVASNSDIGSDSGGGYNTNYRTSLVGTLSKRAISGATVLVDVTLAEGTQLDAVTDYAAMVGLAEVRFASEPPPDSILSLFSATNPTSRLSEQDHALLKTLYKMPLNREGRYHRGQLVRGLTDSLVLEP